VTFWDGSAVVPLLVMQGASAKTAAWLTADTALALWTLTAVEVTSALRRLTREGALDDGAVHQAEARLGQLVGTCHVVVDIEAVKALATRLLRLHPLRAFDALQLGAALHWAEHHPEGRTLHTLDQRLAVAARREGFLVPE
jgi:uncharacterized protein